eukprot:15429314-Heterocapsa_arctica.AAC.1
MVRRARVALSQLASRASARTERHDHPALHQVPGHVPRPCCRRSTMACACRQVGLALHRCRGYWCPTVHRHRHLQQVRPSHAQLRGAAGPASALADGPRAGSADSHPPLSPAELLPVRHHELPLLRPAPRALSGGDDERLTAQGCQCLALDMASKSASSHHRLWRHAAPGSCSSWPDRPGSLGHDAHR